MLFQGTYSSDISSSENYIIYTYSYNGDVSIIFFDKKNYIL